MLYADDTQLYVEFNKSSMAVSWNFIYIDSIKSWMSQNILKLNEDKTEVIGFGSRKYLEGMPSISIRVGDCTITPTRSVRNLGAHFDSRMNMEEFIIKKCRAYQLQLKIARICKYLSNDTCFCIIQGLVTSKLDYANCLLYGVNKVFLHRLQIVQNAAACVILKMRKYNHISRARQELHWLPIQERIAFSILTDVYKALHGLVPTHITDLILLAQPTRLTRSSKNFNIAFPVKVPRNSYGKRALFMLLQLCGTIYLLALDLQIHC